MTGILQHFGSYITRGFISILIHGPAGNSKIVDINIINRYGYLHISILKNCQKWSKKTVRNNGRYSKWSNIAKKVKNNKKFQISENSLNFQKPSVQKFQTC